MSYCSGCKAGRHVQVFRECCRDYIGIMCNGHPRAAFVRERITHAECLLHMANYSPGQVQSTSGTEQVFPTIVLCRQTSMSTLLSLMSSLVEREPLVFITAVGRICTLEAAQPGARGAGAGETLIRLKTPAELAAPPPPAAAAAGGQKARGGAATAEASGSGSRPGSDGGATPAPKAREGTAVTGAAAAPTPAAAGREGAATPAPAAASAAAKTPVPVGKTPSKQTSMKSSRKLVPGSFVEVIDLLLELIMSYTGPVPQQQQQKLAAGTAAGSPTDMEMETGGAGEGAQPAATAAAAVPAAGRAAAPAAAGAAAVEAVPLPADLFLQKLDPLPREEVQQLLVLRMLTDFCLLYNNTVGLLLKRDAELGPYDTTLPVHHHHHSAAGATPGPVAVGSGAATPHTTKRSGSRSSTGGASTPAAGALTPAAGGSTGGASADGPKAGGFVKRLMHVHLVCERGSSGGSSVGASGSSTPTGTLSSNASQLLQAICIRSSDGRRRVLRELVATLNIGRFPEAASGKPGAAAPATTYKASAGSKSSSGKGAEGGKKGGMVQLEAPDSMEVELALKPVPEEGTNKAQLKPYLEKLGCPPPAKVRGELRVITVEG